jgi:hypothetical protein
MTGLKSPIKLNVSKMALVTVIFYSTLQAFYELVSPDAWAQAW